MHMTQGEKEELYRLGKKMEIKKGHCLSSDDHGKSLYYLEEGICALVRYTRDGGEVIYHYFQEGEILGGVPMYLMNGKSPAAKERGELSQFYAKTCCVVYKIRYEDFETYAKRYPEAYFKLSQSIAYNFYKVINHFHGQKEDSTGIRLCRLLLELGDKVGEEYILNKYFNYVELGKYLGVHTVTVTKMMLDLKNQGIIKKRGHAIIVAQPQKLLKIIEEARE